MVTATSATRVLREIIAALFSRSVMALSTRLASMTTRRTNAEAMGTIVRLRDANMLTSRKTTLTLEALAAFLSDTIWESEN